MTETPMRVNMSDLHQFFKLKELLEETIELQKKLKFPDELIIKTQNILNILDKLEFDVFLKTDGGGKGN